MQIVKKIEEQLDEVHTPPRSKAAQHGSPTSGEKGYEAETLVLDTMYDKKSGGGEQHSVCPARSRDDNYGIGNTHGFEAAELPEAIEGHSGDKEFNDEHNDGSGWPAASAGTAGRLGFEHDASGGSGMISEDGSDKGSLTEAGDDDAISWGVVFESMELPQDSSPEDLTEILNDQHSSPEDSEHEVLDEDSEHEVFESFDRPLDTSESIEDHDKQKHFGGGWPKASAGTVEVDDAVDALVAFVQALDADESDTSIEAPQTATEAHKMAVRNARFALERERTQLPRQTEAPAPAPPLTEAALRAAREARFAAARSQQQ